jgi:hypothetical protein
VYSRSSLQGKVRNPTGEGVQAISSKPSQGCQHANGGSSNKTDEHETAIKEGPPSAAITRKKTADEKTSNFDSSKKKQGGHGKGEWQT